MELSIKAHKAGMTMVVFAELALCGYIPKDLINHRFFQDECLEGIEAIQTFSKTIPNVAIVFGGIDYRDNTAYNAAFVIQNGKKIGVQHKKCLPNYDVFDERRYFQSGEKQHVMMINGQRVGVTICEDAWCMTNQSFDPLDYYAQHPVDLMINISASPFETSKESLRDQTFSDMAKRCGCPVLMVNMIGGNDDLVFDGRSMLINEKGEIIYKAPYFEEGVFHPDPVKTVPEMKPLLKIKWALTTGLKDYVHKTGHQKVVIGLSGGIDSAVTAALAVEALGERNVIGVLMPSVFSSEGSIKDAEELAQHLGIKTYLLPILDIVTHFDTQLRTAFEQASPDETEENIQSRIRGTLLMALANKWKALVIATGNKSEIAVGYCTLYGDTNGALSVLSDCSKTTVYHLAEEINNHRLIIPLSTIEKPPSAELRPDQKDSDSLPEYDLLDPLIDAIVEQNKGKKELINEGFDTQVVDRVWRLVKRNEYKRSQLPIGIKISRKSFGSGRRFPLTCRY